MKNLKSLSSVRGKSEQSPLLTFQKEMEKMTFPLAFANFPETFKIHPIWRVTYLSGINVLKKIRGWNGSLKLKLFLQGQYAVWGGKKIWLKKWDKEIGKH